MGVETRQKIIGDTTFRLTLFGAKQGQKVLLRVSKIIAPGLAALAGSALLQAFKTGSLSSIAELDVDIGGAVRQVFDVASDQDLDYLNDAFSAKTEILITARSNAGEQQIPIALSEGKKFEEVFSLRYQDWIAWLTWCLSENYADFFGFKGPGKNGSQEGNQSKSGSPQV